MCSSALHCYSKYLSKECRGRLIWAQDFRSFSSVALGPMHREAGYDGQVMWWAKWVTS